MNENNELMKLDNIAMDSWYGKGASGFSVRYSFEIFKRYIKEGGAILELGPAEGIMTELLEGLKTDLVCVEGAASFCRDLQSRFPRIKVINSLFEDFNTTEKFDAIILGHVLEHVENPVNVLNSVKKFLKEDGVMLSSVPNSRSIHRQAAVDMGLLVNEESLNEMDKHHGHRRVFNPESFRNVFQLAELKIDVFGGYWLKPVSNSQIESTWSDQMLKSFMRLGERYPDIAAEIYIVASLSKT